MDLFRNRAEPEVPKLRVTWVGACLRLSAPIGPLKLPTDSRSLSSIREPSRPARGIGPNRRRAFDPFLTASCPVLGDRMHA